MSGLVIDVLDELLDGESAGQEARTSINCSRLKNRLSKAVHDSDAEARFPNGRSDVRNAEGRTDRSRMRPPGHDCRWTYQRDERRA